MAAQLVVRSGARLRWRSALCPGHTGEGCEGTVCLLALVADRLPAVGREHGPHLGGRGVVLQLADLAVHQGDPRAAVGAADAEPLAFRVVDAEGYMVERQ